MNAHIIKHYEYTKTRKRFLVRKKSRFRVFCDYELVRI